MKIGGRKMKGLLQAPRGTGVRTLTENIAPVRDKRQSLLLRNKNLTRCTPDLNTGTTPSRCQSLNHLKQGIRILASKGLLTLLQPLHPDLPTSLPAASFKSFELVRERPCLVPSIEANA